MAATIQIKRGTSTDWSTANPVLASGELGLDTTLSNIKIGDGITAWNSLNFYDSNSQPLDSTLTAIAAFNTNGFLVQTSPDNFAGRTITAASTKIQISDGNAVAANPSIDVNESNLALNNIGGTLSIAKGGTNSTTALNNNRIINSVGGALVERSAMTNGQLIIGLTGGNPVNGNLNSTYGLNIANGAGDINLPVSLTTSEFSATNITTTSGTYVLATGLTTTPAAGTYLVFFSGTVFNSNNGRTTFVSLFVNGTQVTATERSHSAGGSERSGISFQHPVTVPGGQVVEVRWYRTANTSTMTAGQLTLLRIA